MASSFQRAIGPLLIAPLGAMVEVGVLSILKGGDSSRPEGLVIVLLITALVCYAAELLFVVPLMVFWPRLRQPPALFAAVWGMLVAWCVASLFLGAAFLWPAPNLPPPVASWQSFARLATGLARVGSFGLSSGLVYSVVARVNFDHDSD
jgi:sterol desaturase/sphingolipid hydroxylase (fatty acid hydroxylase superfamily)